MRNGLYFIFKFNEAKKDVDIISEERDRSMIFIAQFDNGNFLYISFIHRPIFTQDTFYYFDIEKKEIYKIEEFGEYDDIYLSDIIILEDGIAFMNSFCANSEFKWEKLYITENINIKSYEINSTSEIKKLIHDDKYFYILNYDKYVFIFDIEKKKFYPNCIKIT